MAEFELKDILFFLMSALSLFLGFRVKHLERSLKTLSTVWIGHDDDTDYFGESLVEINKSIEKLILSQETERLKQDFIKEFGGDNHMKLLGNRLIIKRTIQQTSSIIITQSEEMPSVGEILEMSSNVPSDFKVGDTVVYERYAGMDVPMGSLGNVTIIPCEAVVAVIVPDDKERADE